MPTIWGLLFARLQSSRTAKFTRSFVLFLALFVCKRGAQLVADSIDGVQPGLTTMIVQTVRAALVELHIFAGAQRVGSAG